MALLQFRVSKVQVEGDVTDGDWYATAELPLLMLPPHGRLHEAEGATVTVTEEKEVADDAGTTV